MTAKTTALAALEIWAEKSYAHTTTDGVDEWNDLVEQHDHLDGRTVEGVKALIAVAIAAREGVQYNDPTALDPLHDALERLDRWERAVAL